MRLLARCPYKTVYPRVGGGNALHLPFNALGKGLSPRGRGKHAAGAETREEIRSIPAWAGETRGTDDNHRLSPVYPRVGGGNPGY